MSRISEIMKSVLLALTAMLGLLSLTATSASAAECNRACMTALLTQYADALVANDHSSLPLAEKVRFTENSSQLKLGEGLWPTITGKGGFRQDYLDTTRQIAASHMELKEGEVPVLYTVVLHLDDGKIAGIETLYQRILPNSPFQPTELGGPIRGMNDPVPADKKQSRESMVKTALTYPEGLRIGNFSDGGTPFAPGTYRVENGVITSGPGCRREDCGMYAQRVMLHPGIVASVAAVDEEAGIVLLWMNFGFTNSCGPGKALVTFEAFKIWGGEIHSILAFFPTLPIATPRYWNSSDPLEPLIGG